MQDQKFKIAVGMSGGVDSSVSAYLLKKQGYDVTGVYMICWDSPQDGCAADEDRSYAVTTAAKIGIPIKYLDFKKQYREKVIEYFYHEYAVGRTPNPDVMCNKEIKFGLFFDWAMANGFDFVATGHYARIKNSRGNLQLLTGEDPTKDQSYFLYRLDRKVLSKTLFPVGEILKQDVRKIAIDAQLPSAKRKDSTGICFIGEVDIKNFISQKLPPESGLVKNLSGETIGSHDGVQFFTIGQRHGFKLNKSSKTPLYVVNKDAKTNTLFLGSKDEVKSDKFTCTDIHWICDDPLEKYQSINCAVRIRHLGKFYKCKISKIKSVPGEDLKETFIKTTENTKEKKDESKLPDRYFLSVETNEPIFAPAPGQSAVFYKQDTVLGGGIIF